MKFATKPKAMSLTMEEAYTMVCLRERANIAGIIQNVIPAIECLYAKLTQERWHEIIQGFQAAGDLVYTAHTIVLADAPYSFQNPNHAKAALSALASLPTQILKDPISRKVIQSVLIRIASECQSNAIKMPSQLNAIASECHLDGMGIILSSASASALPLALSSSSSPLTPQGGKAAPPMTKRKSKEKDAGEAPRTPLKGDNDPVGIYDEGVALKDSEAAKWEQQFPDLDIYQIAEQLSKWAKGKGETIEHPYSAMCAFGNKEMERRNKA